MAEPNTPPLPADRPEMRVRPEPRPAPDLTVEDWARYYATIPTRAGLSLLNGLYKTSGSMAALVGLVDQKDVDAYYDDNIRRMKALEDQITSTRGSKFIAEESLIPQEVYGIIGEMASFAVPYLGLSKILTGGQILKPLAATVATDLFIGFGGLSPNDENLFNLLADLAPDSEAAVALESYLGTNPDDPEIVNRTRNAVEALLALGAAEGIIRGVIAAPEFLRKLKQTKDALPAEYAKAVEAVDKLPPGKSTDRLKAAIDPEGKPTAQQANPESPYSSPEEAAEGPNNQELLAQQNNGETVSSVPVSTVMKLADAKTDEELIGTFVEGDGIVTPKPKNIKEDEGLVPFDEDLTPEDALISQTQKHPALGAATYLFKDFEYIAKKPGGSSPGGIYQNKEGEKFLIKMYDDPDQVVNEIIANRFYRVLDIPVPAMQMIKDGDKLYLGSPFIENLQTKTDFFGLSTTGINELGQIYPAAAFIQDNDVVGIDMSNIQFTKQSYTTKKLFGAVPIDHGGAFFFKAMGDKKGYTGDADALDSFLDAKYDPAKLFDVPQEDRQVFAIGAENTLNQIELLNIDTFIDDMVAADIRFKRSATMDYLKKTMKEKQKAFAKKAPELFKEKFNQTYEPPASSAVTEKDLDDIGDFFALDPDKPIKIVKQEPAAPQQIDSEKLTAEAKVSPNKQIKKLLSDAEKLGYNSGFLLTRNDTFGEGLFQLDPPPVTAQVPETDLGKQLGRTVLPKDATLKEKPEGSYDYAGTIYTVPYVNNNGFYINKDLTSKFNILDYKDGRLGYSTEAGATVKSFLQVGKSLATDNPKSLFGVDLPDSVDILGLIELRGDLLDSAEDIFREGKPFSQNLVSKEVIDFVLTNSYGAAPTEIAKSIIVGVKRGDLSESEVLDIAETAHEKLTAAIKKDSDFEYPRMDYSGLHPQGFNQYNDTYSRKYAKFFGRPWESASTGYKAGRAGIGRTSMHDWRSLENYSRDDVDQVLSNLNKDATSIRDAYVSIPVVDEANLNYAAYTKSQGGEYFNRRDVTPYSDSYYENFYKYISKGAKKAEEEKDILIPLQSVALLGQDRLRMVLPDALDFEGTLTKSIVLDPKAASKMPKGSLPAAVDAPNSARMQKIDKDVLSTPAIATGAAAALTAAQLVDEPEDAMDTQMRDLTRPREQVGREVPGLRTKYGRPVYETDEGMVSEQSVTLQVAPDEVINIPSIHDGVRYNRDELRDMYLRGDIQATSRHSDIESAVAAAQTRSDEAFSSVPFDPGTVDDPFDAERTDLFAGQTEDPPADDTGLRIEVRPRPEFEQTDELFNQQRGML